MKTDWQGCHSGPAHECTQRHAQPQACEGARVPTGQNILPICQVAAPVQANQGKMFCAKAAAQERTAYLCVRRRTAAAISAASR